MKKTRLLFFAPAILISAAGFSLSRDKDPLMGSIVKSDVWKMDRANGMEYFRGNVSFVNSLYSLRSDEARYDHGEKMWFLEGNVSCVRRFDNGEKISLSADRAKFRQEFEMGTLWGKGRRIEAVYYAKNGQNLFSLCDRIEADYPGNRVEFHGRYSLRDETNYAASDRALYDRNLEVFVLSGSRPFLRSRDEKYNFAVQGDTITYHHAEKNFEAEGDVKGWIDLGETYDFKIGTVGKKL